MNVKEEAGLALQQIILMLTSFECEVYLVHDSLKTHFLF